MGEASYKILACDGGGIFGVITAKLLQSLDRSVLDNIDLFAGTSTGSIIALGLASGVSIDTIFDLYSSEQSCSQIFQPYLPQADQARLAGMPRPASRRRATHWKRRHRNPSPISRTDCASWRRCCCSRSIAATDCGSC